MFKKLRKSLDDALRTLEERFGGTSEEDVDRLLHAMREELVETKASLPEQEKMIASLHKRRAGELTRAADCVRRAEQAQEIGDQETLEVAVRFAQQHRARAELLEQKREAAVAELELKRIEIAEMTSQLKTGRVQRDALLARARRAKTSQRLHGVSGSATDAFDRMEDRLTRDSDLTAAREELERDLAGDTGALDDLEGPEYDLEADELLEKLKRQMEAVKGGM